MTITALPTPPLRSDPTSFASRGDAFLAALPTFAEEANALAAAMNLNSTTDASASGVLIGTGVKTFTVTAGKSFQPGMYLVIASTASPSTNSMWGQVTSYSGTALVMDIIAVKGSGTFAAWTVSQSAPGGAQLGANTDITSLSGKAVSNLALSGANTDITSLNGLTSSVKSVYGFLYKADASSVVFTKTGANTASIKAGTVVDVGGAIVTFATATAITMPALTAGTDYAIYACADGTVRADASFSAPSGYTVTNSRKIGGFHYAPGGNAAARAGGDTTPAINEYSFWDLKFKPACSNPRGMALVAGAFWSDIYLLGVDHLTNGTSKYNVTIADGSSPPKVPALFGGNGSAAYTTLTWWEAAEVLCSHGKRPPSYQEFSALAFGSTEASSGGTDPVSTILRAAYTSKWGVMLATGNLWVWGDEFGGGAAAASWVANTTGRGSTYQMENAAFFGGYWADTSTSGSRCSIWASSPSTSLNYLGSRGVCDHLALE